MTVHGFYHPAFAPVARVFQQQVAKSNGGAAVCVYQKGRPVVDLWGGRRNVEDEAWERDTTVVCFSTTKGVTSTALHLLVDRGQASYSDPVCKHWPEFGQAGKSKITIAELMSHRAGLYNVRALLDDATQLYNWEVVVNRLAAAAPERTNGGSAYHGLTYGHLVGELVSRISRKPFQTFVADEIAQPLGLTGFHIGADKAALRVASRLIRNTTHRTDRTKRRRLRRLLGRVRPVSRALKLTGFFDDFAKALLPRGISKLDVTSDEFMSACIPAANGLFSARDLAKMYSAWACGGQFGNQRLLSPETIHAASRVQVRSRDRVLRLKMFWRLGFHRIGAIGRPIHTGFGHFGYGGSGAWADPERRLAVAMTVNSGHGSPIGDLRILLLNRAVLKSL